MKNSTLDASQSDQPLEGEKRRYNGARPRGAKNKKRPLNYETTLANITIFDSVDLGIYLGGVARSTIVLWRQIGKGPPYIKLGRTVRYRRADVDAWLAAQTWPRKAS